MLTIRIFDRQHWPHDPGINPGVNDELDAGRFTFLSINANSPQGMDSHQTFIVERMKLGIPYTAIIAAALVSICKMIV